MHPLGAVGRPPADGGKILGATPCQKRLFSIRENGLRSRFSGSRTPPPWEAGKFRQYDTFCRRSLPGASIRETVIKFCLSKLWNLLPQALIPETVVKFCSPQLLNLFPEAPIPETVVKFSFSKLKLRPKASIPETVVKFCSSKLLSLLLEAPIPETVVKFGSFKLLNLLPEALIPETVVDSQCARRRHRPGLIGVGALDVYLARSPPIDRLRHVIVSEMMRWLSESRMCVYLVVQL